MHCQAEASVLPECPPVHPRWRFRGREHRCGSTSRGISSLAGSFAHCVGAGDLLQTSQQKLTKTATRLDLTEDRFDHPFPFAVGLPTLLRAELASHSLLRRKMRPWAHGPSCIGAGEDDELPWSSYPSLAPIRESTTDCRSWRKHDLRFGVREVALRLVVGNRCSGSVRWLRPSASIFAIWSSAFCFAAASSASRASRIFSKRDCRRASSSGSSSP